MGKIGGLNGEFLRMVCFSFTSFHRSEVVKLRNAIDRLNG